MGLRFESAKPSRQGCLPNVMLPLRELRAAAGASEAVLLALFHAAVASQQAGMTQHFVKRAVVGPQGTSDAELASTGLPGGAAAVTASSRSCKL